MAYTFNIENTWGTVSLNSNPTLTPGVPGCTVIDYPAKSAPVQDGTETVDEQFRILVQGTTQAEVNAIVGTIQRAFRTAEKWQEDGSGPRTFFTRSLGTMTTTYRSEIVEADFGVSSFEYVGTGIYAGGFGYKTELSGRLTRRNWWEGAETQIPLTNPNGTANITGLRVYNDNCGTGSGTALHYNWFDVPGTAIAGDLPAAYRLQIGLQGSAMPYANFYIPVAYFDTTPGTLYNSAHWTENLSGTQNIAGGVSNDDYYFYPLGTSATFFSGTISNIGSYVKSFSGDSDYREFSPISFSKSGTEYSIYAKLTEYNVSNSSYVHCENIGNYSLYKSSPIHFRNDSYSGGTISPSYIVLNSTGTAVISIDYMSFVRCNQYREISTYNALDNLGTVYDDELDKVGVYRIGTPGVYSDGVSNSIGIIRLQPSVYHRFYYYAYMYSSSPYSGNYGLNYCDVKLYYRPRFLSL